MNITTKTNSSFFKSLPQKIKNINSFFFHIIGDSICIAAILLLQIILRFTADVFRVIWDKTTHFRMIFLNTLKYIGIFIFSPFLKFYTAFSKMLSDIRTERKKGFFYAIKAFIDHFLKFLFGKKGFAVTLFNYVAPVLSIVFLVNIVSYATGIEYAVRLDVNGQFLGYIESEQIFSDAELIVENRLNSLGSFDQIQVTPSFSIEKVGYSDLMTSYQIADLILLNSDVSVTYAYGVYVNDEFIGAVLDNSRILATLDRLLDAYRTGDPDEEVDFEMKISCEQTGQYIVDSIIDDSIIIDSFSRTKEEARYYTIENGDSHSLIGDKLDLTQMELDRLNPGFSEMDLYVGEQIKYSEEVPQLAVKVTKTEYQEITVAYETEYRDDDTLYINTNSIYRKGENGLRIVTARVTRVNGIQTASTITGTEDILTPVDEILLRGTKPVPEIYSPDNSSYGKFIWPILRSTGYISEYTQWDGGYPGHLGIDFAAPAGTPVYAGGSGVVVLSQYYYNYGLTVIIKHDNGLRTLYAHNSALYVSVDDVVSQGQHIAAVGETGKAYGNHVHFEVRNGNEKLNPIAYLDG